MTKKSSGFFAFIKITLIGLFFTALLAEASFAATIRISSPKIELELSPGQTYSGEIIAENPADEECQAKIYLEDWIYTPGGSGEKKFTPMGSTPFSAGSWITFSPAEETIKPFGRTVVRYTVTVPETASGSYFSVLFLETILGSTRDEEGVSVLVAGRIGALFFIHIKDSVKREGEILALELTPPQGNKPMEINTTFHNTGNVDITVGGNFLIMDAEGKILGRGDLSKIFTFPGDTGKSTTQWIGRLPQGTYEVLMTFDLGKGKSLVEEKTIQIE